MEDREDRQKRIGEEPAFEEPRKVMLRTNLTYTVVLFWFVDLIFLAMIVIGIVVDMGGMRVPLLIMCGLLFPITVTCTVLSMQTAVLDENGILFRRCRAKLVFVKWEALTAIDLQKLGTFEILEMPVKVSWIVLRTAPGQVTRQGGINGKKPPWIIKASPKNVAVIKEYAEKYAANAVIRLNQDGIDV